MAERLSKSIRDELYELASLGLEAGLSDGVRWIMAQMRRIDSSPSGGSRKRTVQLVDDTGKPVRAGRFKIPHELLREAEIIEQ